MLFFFSYTCLFIFYPLSIFCGHLYAIIKRTRDERVSYHTPASQKLIRSYWNYFLWAFVKFSKWLDYSMILLIKGWNFPKVVAFMWKVSNTSIFYLVTEINKKIIFSTSTYKHLYFFIHPSTLNISDLYIHISYGRMIELYFWWMCFTFPYTEFFLLTFVFFCL